MAMEKEKQIEEMADCYIMLAQVAFIFDIKRSELDAMINKKLYRLKCRLEKESENGT